MNHNENNENLIFQQIAGTNNYSFIFYTINTTFFFYFIINIIIFYFISFYNIYFVLFINKILLILYLEGKYLAPNEEKDDNDNNESIPIPPPPPISNTDELYNMSPLPLEVVEEAGNETAQTYADDGIEINDNGIDQNNVAAINGSNDPNANPPIANPPIANPPIANPPIANPPNNGPNNGPNTNTNNGPNNTTNNVSTNNPPNNGPNTNNNPTPFRPQIVNPNQMPTTTTNNTPRYYRYQGKYYQLIKNPGRGTGWACVYRVCFCNGATAIHNPKHHLVRGRHIKRDDHPFNCRDCGAIFQYNFQFQQHTDMACQRMRSRPFECQFCLKRFSTTHKCRALS